MIKLGITNQKLVFIFLECRGHPLTGIERFNIYPNWSTDALTEVTDFRIFVPQWSCSEIGFFWCYVQVVPLRTQTKRSRIMVQELQVTCFSPRVMDSPSFRRDIESLSLWLPGCCYRQLRRWERGVFTVRRWLHSPTLPPIRILCCSSRNISNAYSGQEVQDNNTQAGFKISGPKACLRGNISGDEILAGGTLRNVEETQFLLSPKSLRSLL
jgi:hypothetical protein